MNEREFYSMKSIIAALALSCAVISVKAQDTVRINLNFKRITEGASAFDRSKYMVIHDDLDGNEWESDVQKKQFLEDYDVYFGRNNGGIVWEWNNTRPDPNRAGWPDISYMTQRGNSAKNSYASKTFTHQFESRYKHMMIGGQEHMFPHGQATSRGGLVYEGFEATAEFYAHYLDKFFGSGGTTGKPKPQMLEVINEPFVKVNSLGTTREEMSRYHNVVAKRVKELNPDVLVGGYTAAHPAFESGDFNHWRNNWKTFIDIAGENMDFFSFHLYDFSQNTSDKSLDQYRSGSNIEAIMDMINHYSYLKLGKTLPWSISEYGWLCKECPGGYDQREDWYNVRSFNSMLVQLLERNYQLLNAIPFMLLKANWAKPAGAEYNTYGPRLLREIGEVPGEPAHGGWVYTDLIQFWQLWANVKGTRVMTETSDPDLLADAYALGDTLFLILNNQEMQPKTVALEYFTSQNNGVTNLLIKHSHAKNDLALLDTMSYFKPIEKVQLDAQATMILEYHLTEPIDLNQKVDEHLYFADKYLQPITYWTNMNFNINGVSLGDRGQAVLKIGLGRDHGKSLQPQLLVNGTPVTFPKDWRGYDQKTRDSFFGVIDVPVPYSLLKENNTITLRFSDGGGYVTSMVLKTASFSASLNSATDKNTITGLKAMGMQPEAPRVYPNPVGDVLYLQNVRSGSLVSVYNVQGLLVDQQRLVDDRLNVADLRPGVYLLNVSSDGNSYQSKFIKK